MRNHYKEKYRKFFLTIAEKLRSYDDLHFTFNAVVDLLEIPRPSKFLEKYFIHPSVIRFLLINVVNSDNLTPEDRFELNPLLTDALKKLKAFEGEYFVRFRVLSAGGIYPNIELSRNNCNYSIQNQLPIIWTKNRVSTDRNIMDMSVINWLTRNELKLATSIICAPGAGHTFYLFFSGHNTVEIDWDCVSNIPNELKNVFLREYLELNSKFTPLGVRSWNRKPMQDSTSYEYQKFDPYSDSFKKLFDNFSIQDDLLLRTCNYFVKSIMHWDNNINAEEAIANVFFCIEGCLHLIQKKYGDFNPKLNFKLLKKVFVDEIKHGENLFDFIQEGYNTRITLVHPEPVWGAEWKPFITSEDFYDYFKISRSLLNFILIDEYPDDY